jgi:hypothetical protein
VTYTQLTLNVPTVSVGDVMLASIAVKDGSADVVTAPSGWTQVARTDNDTNATLITYWKAVTGSEPASYTWTILDQTRAEGGITAYSGVDPANPIDIFSSNIGRGKAAVASSINTSVPGGEEVIALFAPDVGTTSSSGYFVAPTTTTMTTKYDVSNDALGPSIAAFDLLRAPAGSTGNIGSATADGKVRDRSAQAIALRPIVPLPVAYWKLDGDSNDAVGSNNGSDINVTYSTANGKVNQGAGFNVGAQVRSTLVRWCPVSLTSPLQRG